MSITYTICKIIFKICIILCIYSLWITVKTYMHTLHKNECYFLITMESKSYSEKEHFPKGNKICKDPPLPTMKSTFYSNSRGL